LRRITVFETAAFDRSATPPGRPRRLGDRVPAQARRCLAATPPETTKPAISRAFA
jgi:hypothetical protein